MIVYRGPLTDVLLTAMSSVGKPIGDAEAPIEGGWQGEPNAAGNNFVPYTVLTSGVAGAPTGPIADPSADWQFGYNLSSFGVSRTQCEWMADRSRNSVQTLKNTVQVLGPNASDKYTIQKVSVSIMGAVQRVDATNPPYWGQVDQFTVWVTKGE